VPGAGAGAGGAGRASIDLLAGGRRSMLADDNTMEQFALPPDLLAGQHAPRSAQRAASHRLSLGLSQVPGSVGNGGRRAAPALSEDRGATMPFSGARRRG
jgi:hypothetical protein